MKLCLLVVSAVLSVGLVAADIPVTWTAGENPETLADGALAFQYDVNGGVLALTATPADGDRIVISGDPLTFAGGSQLIFAGRGALVFENAVAGAGNVTVSREEGAFVREYDSTLLYTNQYTEMFANMTLADWKPVRSDRGSGTGYFDPNNVYFPYHVENYTGDDGLPHQKFQLQVFNNGTFRAILVDLKEENGSVYGKVTRAFYGDKRLMIGEDVEQVIARNAGDPEPGMLLDYYVHTPSSSGGYGVSHLMMARADGAPELVFKSSVASTLNFTVGDDLRMGDAIRVVGNAAFNNTVSGLGTVTIQSAPSTKDPYVESIAGYVNKTGVTLANRSLDDFVSLEATITGTYLSGNEFPAMVVNHQRSGDVATFELQCFSDIYTWRYVLMELRQNGADLLLKATDAGYIKYNKTENRDITSYVGRHSVLEEPYVNWKTSLTLPDGAAAAPVCAKDFLLTFISAGGWTTTSIAPTAFSLEYMAEPIDPTAGVQPFFEDMKVAFSGGERSRLEVAFANGTPVWCAPARGVFEVNDGATVQLGVRAANSTSLMRVNRGGTLRLSRSEPCNQDQYFIVDGGTLVFRDDLKPDYGDTWAYLNRMSLYSGAKITGSSSIRVGTISSPVWRIGGDSPSECVPSILLITSSYGPDFNVTDVTDDAGEDFILRGNIAPSASYCQSPKLKKTGAGTLAHYGTVSGVTSLRVEKGVWMFAGSASGSQAFTVDGGALAAKAGTANAVGALTFVGPSKISVGAGATLAIADCSGATWTQEKKEFVEIDADLANGAVRVGTSAAALTAAQLAVLRCNNGANFVTIDADGYLRVGGSARAGLIFLIK